MKHLLWMAMLVSMSSCTVTPIDIYSDSVDFDWMPDPLTWQRNIVDCRSQPQCNAADLFNRY